MIDDSEILRIAKQNEYIYDLIEKELKKEKGKQWYDGIISQGYFQLADTTFSQQTIKNGFVLKFIKSYEMSDKFSNVDIEHEHKCIDIKIWPDRDYPYYEYTFEDLTTKQVWKGSCIYNLYAYKVREE